MYIAHIAEMLSQKKQIVNISANKNILWVDNGNYLEPHLALFMKLQEAYPEYQKQFSYV